MPRKKLNKNNYHRRRKKPKFLSLRLNLSSETTVVNHRHLDLNHAAAAVEEETAAADFFAAAVDGCGATLAALFGACSPPSDNGTDRSVSVAQDSGTGSPSLTCAAEEEEEVLLRTAMRRGREEREDREEKWVCYEEVTSCAVDAGEGGSVSRPKGGLLLSLKLDYQEIIDAWCDKGPLYMSGPQTVPDLSHDFGLNDGWGSNGAMWTVPENTVGVKVEQELEEELKIRHREASVLRYKEKRQNRLFSKRIRYEVRKINAEKRPRMKGRFVKRN